MNGLLFTNECLCLFYRQEKECRERSSLDSGRRGMLIAAQELLYDPSLSQQGRITCGWQVEVVVT
jgi:hypothetical protein